MIWKELTLVVAALTLVGTVHAQEPVCESAKAILGSAANGAWPAAAPSLTFDGQQIACHRVTDTLVSCTLAGIAICAGKPPAIEEQAAFRTRMQKVYSVLPPAIRQCLADRTPAPHADTINGDGFVRQERGQSFTKAGEPTVRLVDGVTRMISGDYRCETSSATVEFEIE